MFDPSRCILQASKDTVAEIWLWQVGSWKAIGRLKSHTSTVFQMEFSYDDKLLLSVSRDRHFSVFALDDVVGMFLKPPFSCINYFLFDFGC